MLDLHTAVKANATAWAEIWFAHAAHGLAEARAALRTFDEDKHVKNRAGKTNKRNDHEWLKLTALWQKEPCREKEPKGETNCLGLEHLRF